MKTQISEVVAKTEQATSIKYNTMVYELQRAGKKVLVLSLGEAFFDIPLFSFESLPYPSLYHYSNSRGTPELRYKLSEFFMSNYDIPVNYEKEILITSGSKAAIHFAFMATLNPGDEVIIPEPFWVSYPEQVKLCYACPVSIPYNVSVYDFEKYITEKTKVIIINNPHNPTGYVYKEDEIKHLLYLSDKYNLYLFSDEAYSEFVDEDKFISPAKFDREKKHSVVFNSISKNYGISGWRLGYVIANESLINAILKINQHLITCPSTILEYYVEKYFYDILEFTNPQIKAVVRKRKEIAIFMKEIGLAPLEGTSTFYFFVSIAPSALFSEEFCTKLLHEHYIATVPGIGYGQSCDKFIRVSIGAAPIDEIKQGLIKIKELIEETSNSVSKTKVLVVGGGLWQTPLIKYLKDKGHLVYVVDPYLHSPGVKFADKHIVCDVRDAEEIYKQLKGEEFKFVCSDQSDISVNTVSILNNLFGLSGNRIEVTDNFVNKFKMRELASSLNIPCPNYKKIFNVSDLKDFIKECRLPIILKPADSQSSRGVIKIDSENLTEISSFVVSSLKYSNCGYLIAEEFMDGEEVTVEGFASNRLHKTLAISLKKHFRTGIASELRYPADIPDAMYRKLEEYNDRFVNGSGLEFGITHAEYIINRNTGDINIIEIACRGGGTLISSDIVRWVSGVDIYDLFYKSLNSETIQMQDVKVVKNHAILKFFEFKQGKVKSIDGFNEVANWPEILSANLDFKDGDILQPAEDDRSRQGYFIAIAKSKNELDKIIDRVKNTIVISYE